MMKTASKSFAEWLSILTQFKTDNGHCIVKRNDPKHHHLSMWVNRIRKKRRQGLLLDHQKEMLDDIGFKWSVISSTLPFQDGIVFLEGYKERHGNCCVPVIYPPNQRLATWVQNQRAQFVRKQRKQYSYLSDECLEKLTLVGLFDFSSTDCYRSIIQIARCEEKKSVLNACPNSVTPSSPAKNKPIASRPITSFLVNKSAKSKDKVIACAALCFDHFILELSPQPTPCIQ